MDRRQFGARLLGLAAAAASSPAAAAASPARGWVFYAGVGPNLYGYTVDPGARVLRLRHGPIAFPQIVQAGWQNPRTGHLYVASSDGIDGTRHAVAALAVGADGGLTPVGTTFTLPARPIHITVDARGDYLLLAYPRPSGVAVYRLGPDGTILGEVQQRARLATGNYPHEIRVLPSNRSVLIMSRGVPAAAGAPEQPGGMHLFSFEDGQLANSQTVAPNGGAGFRPRNGEFDPAGRWLYAALEAQNQLSTHALSGDRVSEAALFTTTTLATAEPARPGQMLSVSRIHPSGRFLYIANRAGAAQHQGQTVVDGEESLAVFALEPRTGRARLIQSAPLPGAGTRGIGLSPDGRWLAVSGLSPAKVRLGDRIEVVPQAISLYAIGADGRLTLANRLVSPMQGQTSVWAGSVVY